MSSEASDILFAPEGVALKDPAEVERALARMWDPAGQEATGQPTKTATRVSVANLVVVASAGSWNDLVEVLAELSPMYPSRTIALLIGDCEPKPAPITASVSALCHVPQEGQAQVCCEQIVLRAGPKQVEMLDQTLLPFLESDVPVVCWWRFNAGAWPTLSMAIKAIARRFIVDGEIVPAEGLESTEPCAVRDLGWYRTARLRELLAQMFDGCGPEVVETIEHVDIDTGGMLWGEIEGFWLAAFLAGQLGWRPASKEALWQLEPGREGSGGRFRFLAKERPVDVRITTHPAGGPRLRYVRIVSGSSTFELRLQRGRGDEYRATVSSGGVCEACRSVQVPRVRTSQALAAALAGRPVDAAFERAWPVATWIVSSLSDDTDMEVIEVEDMTVERKQTRIE